MKLSQITLAVGAALCSGLVAAAAPTKIAYSAGASAVQGNLAQALENICEATAGRVFTQFRRTGATNNNFVSLVCANTTVNVGNYAAAGTTYFEFGSGIPFEEVRLNVDQGSFSAIQQLNDIALPYFNPATDSNFTPNPATITKLGGVLDTEPESFPQTTLGSLTIPPTQVLGVAQAFGIAVSQPLYVAMYNAQRATSGGATVDKPIPSSCPADGLTATNRVECIPTISKGQMATIMADNPFNVANNLGAEFLGGPAGEELNYARRVDTSGTQAAAQNYFLGLVCSKTSIGVVAQGEPGGTVPGSLLRVHGLGSTGNVRTLLNDATKYTIGVMSGENNQATEGTPPVATSWKWVRVQGAPIGENATPASAGITNRTPVINGIYDFYYEAVYATQGSAGTAFWSRVKTAINGLVPPLGVGLIDDDALLAGYNKGGQTCAFNSSN